MKLDLKQVSALASGKIWVGNASGIAAPVTVSGEITIDNTGAVTLSRAIAPTWTATHTFQKNALATTTSAMIVFQNVTAAAVGAQQVSPSVQWIAQGWKTTATAASQQVAFQAWVLPVQGTANPSALWVLSAAINGGAYANVLSVDSSGNLSTSGSISGTNFGSIVYSSTNGLNVKTQAGGVGGISLTGNPAASNKFTYNTGFVLNNGGASAVAATMMNFQSGSFNSPTTGNCFAYLYNGETFTASSGSAAYWYMYLSPTINQTSTASGTISILTIQPNITSITTTLNAIYIAAGRILLAASTTTYASWNMPAGTAPTVPTDGDCWQDGTNVKIRIGGTTKTFTLT